MVDRSAIEIKWRAGLPVEVERPRVEESVAIENGIRIECDVAVAMRDGVRIRVDIFRPDGTETVPAIIAWSPYGKHQTGPKAFDRYPNRTCVPSGVPGKWTKFEAPDPEYWCPHGYAIINPDARGSWLSEGDLVTIGGGEAEDIHDLIEWIGVQPWCNGKVGMSGNSWLAQCQWYAAATRPPHLAAIAPWEGWSDLYREVVAPGGITTAPSNWIDFVWAGLHSRNRVEDCPGMASDYPNWNVYWDRKQAKHETTNVPTYAVASWNSRLHSRGSFEGFKRLGSKEKWLRIHDGWEWPDYYAPSNIEDLRRFFDRYLKGVANGWEETPRVRIALMDQPKDEPSKTYRAETEWPPARTRHQKLLLDARSKRMSLLPVADHARCAYEATAGTAFFDFAFARDVELTGDMSLKLWVEAVGADDMDLFVVAQKLGRDGDHVDFRTYGVDWPAEPGRGFLRASHRALDPARSRPGQPWHSHRLEERLAPGDIVAVEIEFWPMGCLWHAGESIRIVVAGHPLLHVGNPVTGEALVSDRNKGTHVVHTGGPYDSHLLLPVVAGELA